MDFYFNFLIGLSFPFKVGFLFLLVSILFVLLEVMKDGVDDKKVIEREKKVLE